MGRLGLVHDHPLGATVPPPQHPLNTTRRHPSIPFPSPQVHAVEATNCSSTETDESCEGCCACSHHTGRLGSHIHSPRRVPTSCSVPPCPTTQQASLVLLGATALVAAVDVADCYQSPPYWSTRHARRSSTQHHSHSPSIHSALPLRLPTGHYRPQQKRHASRRLRAVRAIPYIILYPVEHVESYCCQLQHKLPGYRRAGPIRPSQHAPQHDGTSTKAVTGRSVGTREGRRNLADACVRAYLADCYQHHHTAAPRPREYDKAIQLGAGAE